MKKKHKIVFRPKKILSSVVATAMMIGTVATPAIANPGDYYLQSTHTVYSVEALQADTNSSIKNVLRNALPSDVLVDFGDHLLKYTDANTLISQLLVQHKSLTEIATTLMAPNTASSNVDVSTYIPVAPFVSSVSAVNGTITVTLSNVTTATPVLTDFVVKQSINGATATTVTPPIKMNGAVATFTDDVVPATTASQSVVYSVSYKGGASISAPAFVVLAGVNANIGSAADLATALADPSVTSITFTASLPASPNITRPLTMNLGAYILTGDVSFNYTGTGTSILTGNAGTRITGNLTVNTANASFKNGVRVGGTVNVVNVQVGTWTESADGNTLTITDPDGAVITVTGNPGSVTVAEGSGGSLTINVNAGGTVSNITSNAPVNIVVATGATVSNITSAAGSAGTTITNNGTTGTVTADVQTNIVVGTSGTVTNITTAAGASGSTITNNGTAGTITANAPTAITVATGATVTNITAAAGSDGSTITNNGTTRTVTADVPINLVANVPPTNTVTAGAGTVAVTGTGASTVVVTPTAPVAPPWYGGGGSVATVSTVTVTPGTATIAATGGTQQFAAAIAGTNSPAQTVTWSIAGTSLDAGTSIDAAGLLTVAAADAGKTITVTATSTVDTSKNGTATVTVSAAAATVSTVTVTPGTATIAATGGTQSFGAVVAGTNSPAQTVTWSIAGTSLDAGTSINAAGLLTVAAADAGKTITVTATSTVDTSKNGTATVTVSALNSTAVGGAAATQGTSTIAYTLTTGTFDATAGIVNGNWAIAGTNGTDLGAITGVVLSAGNKVATVTVTNPIGAVGQVYTVAPAQAAFATGFTAPAPASASAAAVSIAAAIADVTSLEFTTTAANNTVSITLTGGTFKTGAIAASDFTFTGTDAGALAAGTFTRTSDTGVTITDLTLAGGTNNKVLVKAATQATQATSVAAVASTVIAAAPVNLGTAGNYAILSKAGISSVPNSVITGDIAVSPIAATGITGFSLTADATNVFSTSTQVTGKVYAPGYASPTPSDLTTAVNNMETAYTNAAGRAANYTELYTGDISGKTLTPGVYKWSTGVLIDSDVTLNGGANDVFIFEIAGEITQANGTKIILTGGAQAKNIFWQSADTVAIGTGAHFEGIVLGKTNISMGTNASINGRLLAQTAVTLDQSTVVAPSAFNSTPGAPEGVTNVSVSSSDTNVGATGGVQNAITWNASVTSGVTYNVLRGPTATTSAAIQLGTSGTATNYTDTTATPGATYFYFVETAKAGQTTTSAGISVNTAADDVTVPVLSNGTVEDLGTTTGTTATLKYYATQETGIVKYYYLVQDAMTSAPAIDAIKASNSWGTSSGNPVYNQIDLLDLTAGGNYTAYIVMEDALGNTSNILTIPGINPYSNASLVKLGTPSVTLTSNSSELGGLAFTITASNGATDSDIKEYSLIIASSSSETTPIVTLTVLKNNLSGLVTLDNGITAGNSYVARVQAIVTDNNASYQNSDFSANTVNATAQASQ